MLEYTHRFLAAVSSLLIVGSAVVGMVRVPQMRWVSIPPVVAIALLLEVSFFGAQVVLRGLSPGWAAVDVGSALLVVALMVTAAVYANGAIPDFSQTAQTQGRKNFAWLALACAAVIYVIYVSGILVAGKGSISSCLGWPIYNLKQFRLDGLTIANILRLVLSAVGLVLLVILLVQAWRNRHSQVGIYRLACWVGLAVAVEALVQVSIQALGLLTPLLVIYTVTAAVLWALVVALAARSQQPAA